MPDTVKPTAPGNLHTTAVTSSQVSLAWNGSTDNVGVTGYRVYRDGVPIANVAATTTSYSNGPIAPGTYRYTVRAVDGAANVSDPSNEVTAIVPDTEKPTAPAEPRRCRAGLVPGPTHLGRRERQRRSHGLRDLPRRHHDRHGRHRSPRTRTTCSPRPSTRTTCARSTRPATALGSEQLRHGDHGPAGRRAAHQSPATSRRR